jgi:hypothetical protein
MARSKSPARSSKAAAGGINDPHVQLAISAGLLVALSQISGNGVSTKGVMDFFNGKGDNIHDGHFAYGWLLTLHALNTAQNARGGYWLNALVTTFVATFSTNFAAGVFFGNGLASTINDVCSTSNIQLVFLLWFLTNNDYTSGLWGAIKSSPIGAPLGTVMDCATLAYTTNNALAQVGSVAAMGSFTDLNGYFAMAMPIFKATVVGSSANFFPLDQGFSFENGLDADAERAFVSAFFKCIVGFFSITQLDSLISDTLGFGANLGCGCFIVFLNVVVHLTFDLCPAMASPLSTIQDKIFEFTNFER